MSQNTDSNNKGIQQTSAQWAEVIGQLFDRLTGKGASVTYTFDILVIDIPKAQGPSGQDMGSAKWTFNGKVILLPKLIRLLKPYKERQFQPLPE